jgi:predicted nucleotidyltransferase
MTAAIAMAQVAARDAVVARAVVAARQDDRVAALWLHGSLARGDGDALSDVDLIVVAEPGRVAALRDDFAQLIAAVGPACLVHEAPQNAPLDGRQWNVLYDVEPLPLYVDWNLWPAHVDRPADAKVLFQRRDAAPPDGPDYVEMVARMARGHSETGPGVLDAFRVYMVPIVVKHAARGWAESVAQLLGWLQVPWDGNTALPAVVGCAQAILAESGGDLPPATRRCLERYLQRLLEFAAPTVAAASDD